MPKNPQMIIILGLLTALIPFLGFPGRVRDTIIIVLSLAIAVLGFVYFIKERRIMNKNSNTQNEKKMETFVDNKHQFTKGESEENNKQDIRLKNE